MQKDQQGWHSEYLLPCVLACAVLVNVNHMKLLFLGKRESRFVAFANFHGVNSPTVVNF